MNVPILNGSLLTNVGNMLKGKQRAWKTYYFHIIPWWRIDSIALPNHLPVSLYRISQVFVSLDSFAFLLNGTLMIDITPLSFSSSTRKENLLLLDILYLKKKKMSSIGLIQYHLGFCYSVHLNTSELPYLHIQDIGHQDHLSRKNHFHNLMCQRNLKPNWNSA